MKIAVSYLSIKDHLKENIEKLTDCDIDFLHLDVMDGQFVKNKTLPFDKVKDIINDKRLLDIHLMVNDVYKYIDLYKSLNPYSITFHYEINYDIMSLITYLKKNSIRVGISIKPDTKVDVLLPYLPFIDMVLVMSVEPGAGGQKFIDSSIKKINELVELRDKFSYNYLIEVDGGINDETIPLVKNTDIVVIGSYITNGDYKKRLKNIKEKIYE